MSRRRGNQASAIPVLQDGSTLGERLFREAGDSGFEYLVFEVLGDRFEKLGFAVARVEHVYPGDSEGRYLDLKYLGTNNPYYRWFIENEGKPGALDKDAYHHLCRRHASRCSVNLGRDDVIHIQRWAPISRATASDILEEWGQRRLGSGSAPPERHSRAEATLGATPKAKASGDGSRSRGGVAAPPALVDVDHSDRQAEEEDEEEAEAEPPASSRRPTLKRKRKPAVKDKRETTALDTMLDEGLGEDAGSSEGRVEKRLGQLRAKLQGRKEEGRSKDPASMLANKAVKAAEDTRPRKSKKDENVIKTLSKALSLQSRSRSSKDDDHSDDETDEDDEVDAGELSGSGNWEARRKKLRKIATDKPGKLLLMGLQSMHEQLGQTGGEPSSDSLSPVMVRYLLSMVLPAHPIKDIGESRYRELRTLCQAIDCLLKGRIESAGDVLMQRFKSVVMGLRDHSDRFGRYLEIIPEEMVGISQDELFFARDMAHRAAKADKLLHSN